ncbi:MAG: hypothetical protein AAFX00_08390 [Pseudomonadota bacterium]
MRAGRTVRSLAAFACAGACAGRANAHAFKSGADQYQQFLEGVSVILTYPGLLLPISALGILLGLWKQDGLPHVWAIYIAGLVAGVFLSPFVGPPIAIALMGLGLITAACAALLPRHVYPEAAVLAGLAGLLVSAASFEGHGLFELGAFIHLGIFLGANLALAAPAALIGVLFEKIDAPWTRIGVRILASWTGAILVLMIAFTVSSAPA